MKDEVFNKPQNKQFEFDADVAAVFDDMLARSVPYYKETMALCRDLALRYLDEDGVLYDLGCSTATLLLDIERQKRFDARLIGLDNSEAMLAHARKKLQIYGSDIEVLEADILNFPYEAADVMISNYTMQFIRPLEREGFMQKIAKSLKSGKVFLFSEKVVSSNKRLDRELIEIYYAFKKSQGYSEYEIMQKREALENVLIPYTHDENIAMALRSGFVHCECIFRWANFATFIAIKG